MIQTKKDLQFYILADRIMNGKPEKRNLKEYLLSILFGGGIIEYLCAMRCYAYYANLSHRRCSWKSVMKLYWWYRYNKLGVKLGFTIGYNSLGYGVVIPHYGTIVVNGKARVGNFAVLHTCTCIAGKKEIGDYLYFSTGSQIVGNIKLGDGITVAAHSLVNHSENCNLLLAGAPAVVKRLNYPKWPETDRVYNSRVQRVNTLYNSFYC